MKNKLTDLNNHLFAQLERLSDEEITREDLDKEISRTHAMVTVGKQIIETAETTIRGAKLVAEYGGNPEQMLSTMNAGNTIEAKLPKIALAETKMIGGKTK